MITNVVSNNNASFLLLGASESYTGEKEAVFEYDAINVNIASDVEADNFKVQFSSDGENWDFEEEYTLTQNSNGLWTGNANTVPKSKWFRVVFTNGLTAQSAFRLQSVLKSFSSPRLVDNANDFLLDVSAGVIPNKLQFDKYGNNEVNTSFTVIDSGFSGGTSMPFLSVASPIRIKAGGNANDDGQMTSTLTMAGIFLDSETVTLGDRVYTLQDTLEDANGNVQIAGTKAQGSLSFTGNFLDGDQIVIGAKTYTGQITLTDVDGNFQIEDADQEGSLNNLMAAINLDTSVAGTKYAASTTAGESVATKPHSTLMLSTAKVQGIAGNSIVTTTTAINASWGSGTKLGGLDDTEGTIDNLVAAITLGGTAGTDYAASMILHPVTLSPYNLSPVNGTGTVMDVTCNILGLDTLETLTNGSWTSTEMAGGSGARSVIVTYLDENWDMVTEEIELKGATASDTFNSDAIRILSMEVGKVGTYGGSNTDVITLEATTPATDLAFIPQNFSVAHISSFSVPRGYEAFFSDFFINIEQTNSADVRAYSRDNGDIATNSMFPVKVNTKLNDVKGDISITAKRFFSKMSAKTDVWFEALKNTGGGTTCKISISYTVVLKKIM